MSIKPILTALDRLVQVHESLFQLSLEKTDLLKSGKIEEIQDILKTELQHIQAIDKLEKKRIEAVEEWAGDQELTDDEKTVTAILEKLTDEKEREQLEEVSTKLAKTLVQLKAQEGLNHNLTEQSMQFVQMNLDLISPTIEQVNYGNKKEQSDPQSKRSIFDSKA